MKLFFGKWETLVNRYEICGCGGILNGLSFTTHLAINIGIIIILTYLLKKNETI